MASSCCYDLGALDGLGGPLGGTRERPMQLASKGTLTQAGEEPLAVAVRKVRTYSQNYGVRSA